VHCHSMPSGSSNLEHKPTDSRRHGRRLQEAACSGISSGSALGGSADPHLPPDTPIDAPQ
jgi:hypothetical protein